MLRERIQIPRPTRLHTPCSASSQNGNQWLGRGIFASWVHIATCRQFGAIQNLSPAVYSLKHSLLPYPDGAHRRERTFQRQFAGPALTRESLKFIAGMGVVPLAMSLP